MKKFALYKALVISEVLPNLFLGRNAEVLPFEVVHVLPRATIMKDIFDDRPDIAFVHLPDQGTSFKIFQIIQMLFNRYQIPVICFGPGEYDAMIAQVLEIGGLNYFQLPEKAEIFRMSLPSWMQIAARQRKAYEQLREKEDLLNMITHELKNPLGRATFASGVLAELPMVKRDAYAHQLIQQVVLASEDISRLVKMLLSLAEMESNVHVDKSVVDLRDLIRRNLKNYEFLAQLKEVVLESPPMPDPILITADPVWMGQAVGNLLSNAVKFTPEGGRVRVRVLQNDLGLVVQVIDTGIGIRDEDLPFIFEKFYRTKRQDLREAEGTGLGLAIVREAVRQHGGQVLVDSKPGRGSTFSIVLPPKVICDPEGMHKAPVLC